MEVRTMSDVYLADRLDTLERELPELRVVHAESCCTGCFEAAFSWDPRAEEYSTLRFLAGE